MSKAQYTPGPWTYREINDDSSCIVEYGDYAIAKTFAFVDHQRDSHTANARLIAAAPDMLAALRRAVLALAFASETSNAMRDDYEAVSAAIAKATGE